MAASPSTLRPASSPQYRHKTRRQVSVQERLEQADSSSSSDSEQQVVFERTVMSEVDRAPSNSDLQDIEKKLDLWTRQLNSNIMVTSALIGLCRSHSVVVLIYNSLCW